jgi:hypothetical protein
VCTNGTLRLHFNGKKVSGGENCNTARAISRWNRRRPVEFRSIRIKELPSSNPPAELYAPVDEGFRSIFNGVDLRGWKPGESWTLQGERQVLQNKKYPATAEFLLETEKQYGDAEFIVDVRSFKQFPQTPTIKFRASIFRWKVAQLNGYTRFRIALKVAKSPSSATAKKSRGRRQPKSIFPRGSFGIFCPPANRMMNIYAAISSSR